MRGRFVLSEVQTILSFYSGTKREVETAGILAAISIYEA